VFNWAQYPPTAANVPAFVTPPQAIWFQYMTSLGVASIAAIQAANVAAGQAYAQQAASGALPGVQPSSYGSGGSAGGAAYQSGLLTFTTGNGTRVLKPGDTWTVKITGAAPNTGVSVSGIHPNGQSAVNAMGTTDTQGNWSLSGTIDTDPTTVGNWQETWYVGQTNVGSFSFSVTSGASSSAGGGAGQTAGSVLPTGTGSNTACDGSSFSLAGYCIPIWALGVGVAVVVFGMGGRH